MPENFGVESNIAFFFSTDTQRYVLLYIYIRIRIESYVHIFPPQREGMKLPALFERGHVNRFRPTIYKTARKPFCYLALRPPVGFPLGSAYGFISLEVTH